MPEQQLKKLKEELEKESQSPESNLEALLLSSLLMNFFVDKEKSKIKVEREFAVPVAKVWSAFTESEILDQ
ncbi:hypothetical protein GCM10011325_37730 [Dyadobacter sediminis]|nr:hypothetical protein GCM10011325_37730 [Dyadobacter sediminis]